MPPHEVVRSEVRRDLEDRVNSAPTRKKIRWRLGRRGAFLVLMGSLYLGLAYLYGAKDQPDYVYDRLELPIRFMGWFGINDPFHAMTAWGVLCGISGLIAIVTAWWPPGKDAWGFQALWAFTAAWSVLNLVSGIFLGAEMATVSGVVYAIYAATIIIVSGMPDASPISRVTDDER